MSFADDRESSYIYKCMQALQPVMQENVYEIPGRTTIVAMFNESLNGMYASKNETKANDGVISSGALLIEKKSLHVCPLDWSPYNPEPIVFKIKDSAGKLKLRFQYGKKNSSGQMESFEQSSRYAFVSDQASGKVCKPVDETEKTRGQNLLKKIILSAIQKDIAAKGVKDYQAPVYCSNILGITSGDIADLTQPKRAPAVEPQKKSAEEIFR